MAERAPLLHHILMHNGRPCCAGAGARPTHRKMVLMAYTEEIEEMAAQMQE